MSDNTIFKVNEYWKKEGYINKKNYDEKYLRSINDNENFWREEGKRIKWIKPYTKIKDVKYSNKEVHIKWFYDGTLNASANCIDRHLHTKGDNIAIIWEGDNPNDTKKITYNDLYKKVCQTANGLKKIFVAVPII